MQLQKQEMSRLGIPPTERDEEWVQQMASVHGQLIECLEQLVVRDEQLAEDATALDQFQLTIRKNTDHMVRMCDSSILLHHHLGTFVRAYDSL